MDYFGPSSQEFVEAYVEAYGEEPSYHAAGGFQAGLLLQKAIEDSDSIETEAVAAALNELDILTFFGSVQFDTTEESHGLQIGHSMMYIQWQQIEDMEDLEKVIVWPLEAATADTLYPLSE